MTISLDHAIVYDIETPEPRVFTFHCVGLFNDTEMTFEISCYRDDRASLLEWFEYWREIEAPMISFNGLAFDYPVLHFIWQNPYCSVEEIYQKAQDQIFDHTPFKTVRPSDCFAPQIDLYKIMHFDNRAKSTSLKALQFAMRSDSVMEMPIPFGQPLTEDQVRNVLIPYNRHDTTETKKFALFSLDAIKFRIELIEADMVRGDVLNFNDTKIGSRLVEQRLGDELCYTWETGRKEARQTIRDAIRVNDIIFPNVEFRNPEFARVLAWLRNQTLSADEITGKIKTKGVFTGISANVGGIDFVFGTGGMHASVSAQRFQADDDYAIVDIDVAGMYPAIAIANQLYPEHLGERFVFEFAQLPLERAKYKKGTGRSNALKLGGNATIGNTNNVYSCFLDPQMNMSVTINGQLAICMLAEWLLSVETLQIIQANTDGITYRCHRAVLKHAEILRTIWERTTRLTLEEVRYSRMWIRDVNNYVSESVDGKLKQKGAYWFPRKFPDDLTGNWHKDYSAQVIIKAAVAHMVEGADIERFIYGHSDPFDFMCRAKVDRSSKLMIGDQEVQRITRYYVAHNGGPMRKISPPTGEPGTYRRKNGVSQFEYDTIMGQIAPGTWDERIHTKNKSKYETREMGIEAGYLVAECNEASRFDFSNLNYEWYVENAKKLVIV